MYDRDVLVVLIIFNNYCHNNCHKLITYGTEKACPNQMLHNPYQTD